MTHRLLLALPQDVLKQILTLAAPDMLAVGSACAELRQLVAELLLTRRFRDAVWAAYWEAWYAPGTSRAWTRRRLSRLRDRHTLARTVRKLCGSQGLEESWPAEPTAEYEVLRRHLVKSLHRRRSPTPFLWPTESASQSAASLLSSAGSRYPLPRSRGTPRVPPCARLTG